MVCRVALIALSLLLASCGSAPPKIVVGAKNFTEQLILGEIVAQHLEKKLGSSVERRFHLGGALLAHGAVQKGDIDLYPEYTGTALTAILNQPAQQDPRTVWTTVRTEYSNRFGLDVRSPLGLNNSFALVVRGEDARAMNLKTLSDAAQARDNWKLGAGYEFSSRPDGLPKLVSLYGLELDGRPRLMDLGLLYQALSNKQVDIVSGNTTDGVLSKLDAVILEDDRQAFPPYEACLIVNKKTLTRVPALAAALDELNGKITTDAIRRMNYLADTEKRAPREIAAEFLKANLR